MSVEQFFSINTYMLSDRVISAFEATLEYAKEQRPEFITPEHLLLAISQQEEFAGYCRENRISLKDFQEPLLDYLNNLEKIEDEEHFPMVPSHSMLGVVENLRSMWERQCEEYDAPQPEISHDDDPLFYRNIDDEDIDEEDEMDVEVDDDNDGVVPISISDVVFWLSYCEDTVAQNVVKSYITRDKEMLDKLHSYYLQDVYVYMDTHSMKEAQKIAALEKERKGDRKTGYSVTAKPLILKPGIHAEAFINGKKVDLQKGQSEIYDKMVEGASKLMGALRSLGSVDDDDEEIDESFKSNPSRKEQWEELVTCINDTYETKNPLIGRKKEMERTIRILCRRDKNNPLFIGEPGVGKTALIYGLAKMIEEGDVPKWLRGQRIYSIDMASLVAGTNYHGDFEKRIKTVLEGAKKSGKCILYIDEIHTIMDAGGANNTMNAADMMKPYLEDGTVRFIGSTTYQDYNKYMADQKAIVRRFEQVDIKEPTIEETIEIVEKLLPVYEKHHGVKYDKDAVAYVVEQSGKLITDRFLPDKAIDIIDEAGAYLQQHPLLNKNGEPKAVRYQKVDKSMMRMVMTDICRIDAKALSSETNEELKDLDKRIGNEIYGQDEAIKQVVRAVMMSKAGLLEPDKPIASLLFVGPTGVGKTEVCKILAKELGVELVRFDMSEYTEKHTISKLIGSPAGYVGYEEGGLLTAAIRRTPNCVLLLDEIEKAHTDIYNILLQVMDYARLTDNKGNKANFRNVVLIMTSNAGAQYAGQASIGFGAGESRGQAMLGSIKKSFKPEFLNRLSATVVFNDMDKHMASLILDKKLKQLRERLKAKNVEMTLSDDAYELLLTKGFTPQYGAREMDRTIQQYLTPLLIDEILFGKLIKGGTASVIKKDDGLAISN